MHVEDHPIEYGEFEGVIPSGYGAGIVMLWDRGTWTPEVEDVDAALAKGDLKFTLDGYKLKGSWVLVRTQGWGGSWDGKSWLLIKHRDDWSGAVDIAEFAPLSVKTKHDFAEILAQDNPDIWRSERPAKAGDTGKMFERIIRQAMEMRGVAAPPPTNTKATLRTDKPATTVRKTRKQTKTATKPARARSRKA
jgi:bifunctional non-homologous end joining protein LigD